ncbi:MAG TPA: hypothetical protein VGF79_08395 [Bacteroidia bacterium]
MKRFKPQILFFLFLILGLVFLVYKVFEYKPPKIKSLSNFSFTPDVENGVFIFLSSDCPICKKYQGSFKTLQFKGRTVYFVFPGQQDMKEITQFAEYDEMKKDNVLLDNTFELTKYLLANVTPEVVLRHKGKTVYKGKIDNRFKSISSHITRADTNYLENALISLEKNGGKDIVNTQAVGCFIEPR